MLAEGNARLAAARLLTRRVRRDQVGEFLAEGPQSVREAVARPGIVLDVFATTRALQQHGDWLAEQPAPIRTISDRSAAALSETKQPQGLIARCRYVGVGVGDVMARGPRLIAILAGIADPGNAGMILRSADAAGADAVIFTQGSVDPYNGKCVRASAGSLFHLPIVRAASYAELHTELTEAGLQVLGATASAERSLGEPDIDRLLVKPTAWVLGSEAHGLSSADSRTLPMDELIRIPIWGRAESLNLAAAASICLYASATAQRRSRG